MNRIQELREAAGLTQDELGQRVGSDAQMVGRHERGERKLTLQWMARYAMALGVTPAEIMGAADIIEPTTEVEAATIDGMPGVSEAIALRGLKLYRVIRSQVSDAGIATDSLITVDTTPEAIGRATAGDLVLLRVGTSEVLLLRQFVPPALVMTNMPGPRNTIMRMDDRSSPLDMIGVVIRRN